MLKRINLPLSEADARTLRAGDSVLLSGVCYTARDAAHKRFIELIDSGEPLPFDMDGQTIYYAGPTPAPEGRVIGSAGPTTSGRMDAYTPRLIELGLRAMIGKGARSDEVKKAMRARGCVYFGATGGAAALYASRIIECDIIAFPELRSEAVRRLVIRDFPVTVLLDVYGGDQYEAGRARYSREV